MKYVCGNWKASIAYETAKETYAALNAERLPENITVIIFPEMTHIRELARMSGHVKLGSQHIAPAEYGAYTGLPAGGEVRKIARYVLLGHSEVRFMGVSNEYIAQQLDTTVQLELTPLLCVGETQEERDAGKTISVLEAQLSILKPEHGAIVAYEPRWAIGTGVTPTHDDIMSAIQYVKSFTNGIPVLYGGSVKTENVLAIAAIDICDGVLVGGASTNVKSFAEILRSFA